ncbi:MAG: amidinotransferase, partial [Mesorhizobium sp.]
VQDVIDYSGLEHDGLFLEGTGAMVLDHIDRVAYAVRSDRTDPIALERFSTHFNFEPMAFDARDESGSPVYHTNVLMCVATGFAMIGLDMITDRRRRDEIVVRQERSGRRVIALSNKQIRSFAGNAIELHGNAGRLLALSATALTALEADQIATIEDGAKLVPLEIPTIEKAGGSVRCTLAGVHLTPR